MKKLCVLLVIISSVCLASKNQSHVNGLALVINNSSKYIAAGTLLSYDSTPTNYSANELKSALISSANGVCSTALYTSESKSFGKFSPAIKTLCIGGSIRKFSGNIGYVNQVVGNNFDLLGKSVHTAVRAYRITYDGHGVNNEDRVLSGAVFVPENGVPIKGIVLYFHGTEGSKNGIPSCFAKQKSELPGYCREEINSKYINMLGGVLATQGYIVVAPDYIGYGVDSHIMHPYVLFPEVNAISGIDMLHASRIMLDRVGILAKSAQSNLYLTGYSEGGAYTLWTSRLVQTSMAHVISDDNLVLKMTSSAEGAYDLNKVQMPFELADVKDGVFNGHDENENTYNVVSSITAAFVKPILSSFVFSSYIYYRANNNYESVINPQFYNLECGVDCTIPGLRHMNLLQIFSNTLPLGVKSKDILKSIQKAALARKNPNNGLNYDPKASIKIRFNIFKIIGLPVTISHKNIGQNNSIAAFIHQDFIQSDSFQKLLINGGVYDWQTKSPVDLISLAYDSVVTVKNTDSAYTHMVKLSPGLVSRTLMPNYKTVHDLLTLYIQNKLWLYNPQVSQSPMPIDHFEGSVFAAFVALRDFNAH